MKKKVIVLLLIFMSMLNIHGCANKPSNVSDGVYNLGKEILSVADDYLDMKMSAKEAHGKIDKLNMRFNDFKQLTTTESLIEAYTLTIKFNLSSVSYGDGSTYEDVLEARNKLAEKLNQKIRNE